MLPDMHHFFGTLVNSCSLCSLFRLTPRSVFSALKTCLWPPGIRCPPADQTFLPNKHPDARQGAVCDSCVDYAHPSLFFRRRCSGVSSSAPQSVDSGLQVPSDPLVVSGAATALAAQSVGSGVECDSVILRPCVHWHPIWTLVIMSVIDYVLPTHHSAALAHNIFEGQQCFDPTPEYICLGPLE